MDNVKNLTSYTELIFVQYYKEPNPPPIHSLSSRQLPWLSQFKIYGMRKKDSL